MEPNSDTIYTLWNTINHFESPPFTITMNLWTKHSPNIDSFLKNCPIQCTWWRKYAATAFQGIQKDGDEDERSLGLDDGELCVL